MLTKALHALGGFRRCSLKPCMGWRASDDAYQSPACVGGLQTVLTKALHGLEGFRRCSLKPCILLMFENVHKRNFSPSLALLSTCSSFDLNRRGAIFCLLKVGAILKRLLQLNLICIVQNTRISIDYSYVSLVAGGRADRKWHHLAYFSRRELL